ncbi:DNA binding protein [Streptomyces phage Saftant]|jgi:hypothetical protein|uniref:DNA binding protein n=1 Tax=Streptomyces phage Saftant TaxID=2601693 RepID=A0A5J6D8B3_9CAUD|nr:DNA binding protein [Streptomyces phage Saftant]QEQ94074.1 DNA binding protein [Streptomyces phage Saftant]WJN62820.1 hypothetical protein [Streptomyces phage phiScoe2]WMI34561.1 helix-turn-helix DNA binding domain protein [Streptomyces phage Dexers]
MPLPGTEKFPKVEAVWQALGERERDLFFDHLFGGTSADWLSTTLRKYGHDVSASTIRTYRRSLNRVSEG